MRFNQPLSVAYYLKEELRLLWSQPSFERMTRFLHNWCAQAMESGIAQMMSLAKTLRAHATGILNYSITPFSPANSKGSTTRSPASNVPPTATATTSSSPSNYTVSTNPPSGV